MSRGKGGTSADLLAFFLRNLGSKISGTFYCRRGEDNSRELDVEIHYRVEHPPGSKIASEAAKKAKGKVSSIGELTVQTFRVR